MGPREKQSENTIFSLFLNDGPKRSMSPKVLTLVSYQNLHFSHNTHIGIHLHHIAIFENFGRVSSTYNTRNSEFSRNDCCVTREAPLISHDCPRKSHYRQKIRTCHFRDQNIALRHLAKIFHPEHK